ncbi:hypothetical protein PP301_gp060 [Gordonia phage GMA2]|uniref:Uncharacterized protein n=1 Tax=Gordonia phage GMA2 TaxID=1647283 RepID=A0A0K0N7D8_9CAUD|nr:hypothetical protein PP301_gp060 [Gordonia phage GMA2]AKJ72662.1 hypothetical protein GMA2_124 [Gordonia phage GMA2]
MKAVIDGIEVDLTVEEFLAFRQATASSPVTEVEPVDEPEPASDANPISRHSSDVSRSLGVKNRNLMRAALGNIRNELVSDEDLLEWIMRSAYPDDLLRILNFLASEVTRHAQVYDNGVSSLSRPKAHRSSVLAALIMYFIDMDKVTVRSKDICVYLNQDSIFPNQTWDEMFRDLSDILVARGITPDKRRAPSRDLRRNLYSIAGASVLKALPSQNVKYPKFKPGVTS